jgi:hypothetical protein
VQVRILHFALGVRAKHCVWLCGLWLLVFLPATVQAQTMNPTTVQFVASSDQNAISSNGAPIVTSYQLDFYLIGAAYPFQTLSLGKPTPDGNGNITVNFANLLGSALPLPGTVYDATVVAIGPGGSGASALSNTFEYISSCSYSVSPTNASIVSGGAAASVGVTTTSGCGWTATSNASWLTVTSGASGSGSGTVNYSAVANVSTSPRSGTLTVAGTTVTVTEAAPAPAVPPPPGQLHIVTGQ